MSITVATMRFRLAAQPIILSKTCEKAQVGGEEVSIDKNGKPFFMIALRSKNALDTRQVNFPVRAPQNATADNAIALGFETPSQTVTNLRQLVKEDGAIEMKKWSADVQPYEITNADGTTNEVSTYTCVLLPDSTKATFLRELKSRDLVLAEEEVADATPSFV